VCAKTQNNETKSIKKGEVNKEEKYILKQKENEKKLCVYKLDMAKKFYINGDFDIVKTYLDEVLSLDPNNEKANELKNKILILKEKSEFYKRALADDYYIELRKTIKDNNFYEGLLYVKKIKDLFPDEYVDVYSDKLNEEKELVFSTLVSKRDKKIFVDSINAFLNENYTKATKLLYKLSNKYPRFMDVVRISNYNTIVEKNKKRAQVIHKKALKAFRAWKLGQAKTFAEMAYSLQQENVKLKVLIEQLNMEIM
jgi:tetratricopeptide (TPR) repeat protein